METSTCHRQSDADGVEPKAFISLMELNFPSLG